MSTLLPFLLQNIVAAFVVGFGLEATASAAGLLSEFSGIQRAIAISAFVAQSLLIIYIGGLMIRSLWTRKPISYLHLNGVYVWIGAAIIVITEVVPPLLQDSSSATPATAFYLAIIAICGAAFFVRPKQTQDS